MATLVITKLQAHLVGPNRALFHPYLSLTLRSVLCWSKPIDGAATGQECLGRSAGPYCFWQPPQTFPSWEPMLWLVQPSCFSLCLQDPLQVKYQRTLKNRKRSIASKSWRARDTPKGHTKRLQVRGEGAQTSAFFGAMGEVSEFPWVSSFLTN